MPTNIIMPQMGESIYEGTITKWLKQEGEPVRRDEPLFEISTDKVDSEIPSPVAGVLEKIIMPVGSKVPIHTVVAIVDDAAAPAEAPAPVFSSPQVRRIASEEGVDLGQVEGSGWKGRITKKDVMEHMAKKTAPAAQEAPKFKSGERVRVVPMGPMRAKIAEHMILSRRTSAHVTTVFEVDMNRVMELREKHKKDFERVHGIRLTVTPFFAMACIRAIEDFPVMNSSVDGENIIYKRDVNLGVAVAVAEGLIVPVVKTAQEKSFLGLSSSIQELVERARTKKLVVDDVQGGTFTLTNPGQFGGLFGTPIINQPQVAIVGVGTIEKRPVAVGDAIALRWRCYVELSFDHRVIDGVTAEQFMARLKGILEGWDVPLL